MAELAARTGVAIHLATKDELVVTNTYGQQVVDTWALAADDVSRFASASHTWMSTGRLTVRLGDELVDTTRTPMLAIVGDTSGGRHDLLIPSCDVVRYRQLGVQGHHDNCRDNYFAALAAADIQPLPVVPQPLNLFMRVPVAADGSIAIEPPVAGPGSQVRLRALQDVVVVLSACPQDIAPTNGLCATPRPVEYDVVRAS